MPTVQKTSIAEFNFIAIKDIHISDQNPRSRVDDYKASILNKLTQVGKVAVKLKADAVFIAGDLFNLKAPSKNSHQLNQELIKEFKNFGCPIYMIEGNHDISNNSLESLSEQPLGVLFSDGTLKQLREAYIEKKGFKVSLIGVPYTENLELSTLEIPPKEGFISQICLMHIYAGPTSGSVFNERLYGYDELARLSPDIFVLGHYHVDQGIQKIGEKHFINLGALSRGSISVEDINNQPSIGIIKILVNEDKKISYYIQDVKLKVKKPEEVFDLKKRKEEEEEVKKIEAFVNTLMSDSSTKSEEDKNFMEIIKKMDIAEAVKEKTLYFIQEAVTKGA